MMVQQLAQHAPKGIGPIPAQTGPEDHTGKKPILRLAWAMETAHCTQTVGLSTHCKWTCDAYFQLQVLSTRSGDYEKLDPKLDDQVYEHFHGEPKKPKGQTTTGFPKWPGQPPEVTSGWPIDGRSAQQLTFTVLCDMCTICHVVFTMEGISGESVSASAHFSCGTW
jgi:hypothetical protein